MWATPALHRDLVIAPTDTGRLLGIDRATGVVRWEKFLPGPLWSSPVVVDDVLIQGDCAGFLHGFDVSQTQTLPDELWSVELGGCIESTPPSGTAASTSAPAPASSTPCADADRRRLSRRGRPGVSRTRRHHGSGGSCAAGGCRAGSAVASSSAPSTT